MGVATFLTEVSTIILNYHDMLDDAQSDMKQKIQPYFFVSYTASRIVGYHLAIRRLMRMTYYMWDHNGCQFKTQIISAVYLITAILGMYCLLVFWWYIMILKIGKALGLR